MRIGKQPRYQPYRPELFGGGRPPLNPFGPTNQPPTGPGGGTGVEHDYGFRDDFGLMTGRGYLDAMRSRMEAENQGYLSSISGSNQLNAIRAGLMSGADRDKAVGMLADPRETARRGSIDGGISDLEFDQGVTSARQGVAESARAMQGAINSSLSSRGISNPLAGMVTGMAGQFAAGGAAGRARSDMTQQRSQNRLGYANTYGNIAGQQADIQARAVKEGVGGGGGGGSSFGGSWGGGFGSGGSGFDLKGMTDIYNQFRNQNPRPDGTQWGNQNRRPRPYGGDAITHRQRGYLG